MSERVRALVESEGRVELNDGEMDALARTKAVHIGLFLVFIPGSVWFAHRTRIFGFCVVAAAPLWVGGLVECIRPGAAPAETFARLATRVAAMFATLVGSMVFVTAIGF